MNPEQSFGQGGLNGFLDADDLVDQIGLDDDEIAWRKAYIGFDAEDERRLRDLESLLRENQHQIADDFYDNVLQYDETRAIVDRSPKGVDALKRTQRAYLVSLATGTYDQQFFANRARIGKLHELLDMPLKQYVGQYGVYYELLLERLDERVQQQVVDAIEAWAAERDTDEAGFGGLVSALGFGDDGGETGLEESFEETVRAAVDDGMMDVLALLRLLNLDMQIATETYVDSYARRLEESIERRERLAGEVEADVQQPIEELHEASESVATRAETISSHTATQATKTNRAATELGELSAAVEEVASVTDEVRQESDRTEQLAAEGVDAADDALAELEAIEDATTAVSRSVADLEEQTREIDAVVDRLDALAERTTVLAKNAKIEASRTDGRGTGSQTMGVIADEVESFAEQTKRDLAAIETAVEEVRDDAIETVETTEETVDRVDDGTDRVRETMASLEEIHVNCPSVSGAVGRAVQITASGASSTVSMRCASNSIVAVSAHWRSSIASTSGRSAARSSIQAAVRS
ncbi:protoglobin domain-containing protein [Natronorubrum sp. DTA7]|uniref:protoglobin domain-containing protein n=1 Tax=Natronorubrum sp. DTA7 TaxID=3447016 RepID=UPI003F85654A